MQHDVFANTIQKSRAFLAQIQQRLEMKNEDESYTAFRAVMTALRDRLPAWEAAKLAAHLPLLLKGAYYDSWKPAHDLEKLHLDAFMTRIAEHYPPTADVDPPRLAHAVLGVVCEHMPKGAVEHLRATLPADLRVLIPAGPLEESAIVEEVGGRA